MPTEPIPSPRNAIRDWLIHIPQTVHTENTEVRPGAARNDEQCRSRQYRRGEPRLHEAKDHVSSGRHSCDLDGQTNEKHHSSKPIRTCEPLGLAKQLGLHSPFQAMERRAIDEECRTKDTGEFRKRKRKHSSSTTSYLEPAMFGSPNMSSYQKRQTNLKRQTTSEDPKDNGNTPSALDSFRLGIQGVSSSPPKGTKAYERKPRHKTKKDKYDLKQNRKSEKAPVKTEKPTTKRAKRKEKSGAALLHKFTAKNVASDRLTLKPATKLGLFTKGRASSPVRRRGLPDLSFSEITFLNTRREAPIEPSERTSREKTKKKNNAIDSNEEISRFFESAAIPLAEKKQKIPSHDINRPSHRGPRATEQSHGCLSSSEMSALPPVSLDLPGRPFLGFGERGPHLPSTNDPPEDLNVRMPPRGSSSHPISYYTWSQSPAVSLRHKVGGRSPLGSAKVSPGKTLAGELHSESRPFHSKARLEDDGLYNIQKVPPESIEHDHPQGWTEEYIIEPQSRVGCRKPNSLGRSIGKRGQTKTTSKDLNSRSSIGDSINDSLESRNIAITNAKVPAEVTNALHQSELDHSRGEEDSFTKALDAIFDKLESGIANSNTTNELEQEPGMSGIPSIQQRHREVSTQPEARRDNMRLRTYATHSGFSEGQSPDEQKVRLCEQSPMHCREKRFTANPSPLSIQGTAPWLQRPDIKLSCPPNSRIWRGPTVVYGQELEARKPSREHCHISREDALHGSRGSSLRLSTARAYGTPVSLDPRPFGVPNPISSYTPHMVEKHARPCSNHFGENRFSEDVLELQGEGKRCDGGWEEQAQTEIQDEADESALDMKGFHYSYEMDANALEQAVSQNQSGSSYSNSYDITPGNHQVPYGYSRTHLGSRNRTISRGIFGVTEEHRGIVPHPNDEEPGLVGFWKSNKLY